jgi:hypothetical protein
LDGREFNRVIQFAFEHVRWRDTDDSVATDARVGTRNSERA